MLLPFTSSLWLSPFFWQHGSQLFADTITVFPQDPDPSCVRPVLTTRDSFLSCQFHVVYSHSYSVPVLYFNICRTGVQGRGSGGSSREKSGLQNQWSECKWRKLNWNELYSTLLISRLPWGLGMGGLVDLSIDLPIQGIDKSTFSNTRSTYPRYGNVYLF